MNGYTDIHCHIIPGVDDGAKDINMSMRMIKMAYDSGFRMMIATPHYEIGQYENNQEKIIKNLNILREHIDKKYPDFKIYIGNEIFYSYGVVDLLNEEKIFTMAGSKYVLVEFSPNDGYKHIRSAVYELVNNGYIPIIAHCERYEHIMKDLDRVGELVDAGAYIQINSRSVAGEYGISLRRKLVKLIKDNLVHFIATDTHSDGKRNPKLEECLKYLRKKTDEKTIEKLLKINPEKVISNEYV